MDLSEVNNKNFKIYCDYCKEWVEKGLDRYIKSRHSIDPFLSKAMSYSVFSGGKRIRPILVHTACILADGSPDRALAAACAVEFIHTYSLIHDDLPAMDDADFRRRKPTCHKKFGEATAILAGDALQSLAFEIIAATPMLSDKIKIQHISELAKAIGCQGMAAGQSLDINSSITNKSEQNIDQLEIMHTGKTGTLITASLMLGALAGNANNFIKEALSVYGKAIGLAFQIRDDILDVTTEKKSITGKPVGVDEQQNKMTYVTTLGLEKSYQYLDNLLIHALDAIKPLKKNTSYLVELANYISKRKF